MQFTLGCIGQQRGFDAKVRSLSILAWTYSNISLVVRLARVLTSNISATNAQAEIAAANAYPNIRTMTVGETWTSYEPLTQLHNPPILPWSKASNTSIGFGNWSATSAVCW